MPGIVCRRTKEDILLLAHIILESKKSKGNKKESYTFFKLCIIQLWDLLPQDNSDDHQLGIPLKRDYLNSWKRFLLIKAAHTSKMIWKNCFRPGISTAPWCDSVKQPNFFFRLLLKPGQIY